MVAGKPRKPPSHSDFTKSRSSLKAKQRSVPTNSTNTSFKARSIVLPNQSSITDLEARRATKLTDERGRGVVELVTVLRGVGQNAGATSSKSEALDSLGQLLPRLPDKTGTTLSLLPVVLPLITSSAANVRQSLHRFVVASLASLPAEALPPYATTMTLWLTSGMNHIWKEVREDAAKLAEAVIDVVGADMVKGWQLGASSSAEAGSRDGDGQGSSNSNNGQRLFTSLLTSLGVTHGSSSNNNNGAGPSSSSGATPSVNIQSDLSTSPLSKMRLLRCLHKLVRCQSGLVVASQGTTASSQFPLWIFRSCFTSSADWEAFVSVAGHNDQPRQTQASTSSSYSAVVPFTTGTALIERTSASGSAQLCDIEASAGKVWGDGEILAALRTASGYSGDAGSSSNATATSNPYLALYSSLHPLLLSTFLDHAPAALGPDAASSSRNEALPRGLRLIDSVLSLARTLGRAALRSSSSTSSDTSHISGADKAAITHLSSLLDRASVYFPFEQRASQGGLVDERTGMLRRLSAAWCELVGVCRMVLGPSVAESSAAVGAGGDTKGKRKRKADISAAAHLAAVEEYLVSLLTQPADTKKGQDLTSIAAPTSQSQQQQGRLSEEEYLSLLPTIWHLISHSHSPSSSDSASLLQTTITHWSTLTPSSTSGLHSLGLSLLLSLSLLASQPPHSLSPALRSLLQRPSAEVRVTLRDGFLAPAKGQGAGGLGKALYELASRPGREKELCGALRCTLEVVRSHSPLLDGGGGAGEDVEARLAASLCPLFWVPAVVRKGGQVVRKEAKGPYSRAAQRMGAARQEMDGISRALAGYLEDEEGLRGAMRRAGVLVEQERKNEEDGDTVMHE